MMNVCMQRLHSDHGLVDDYIREALHNVRARNFG